MITVIVDSTTLFHIASLYLRDATAWGQLATINGIEDPWLSGLTSLKIPTPANSSGGPIGFS
jgi:hypothetical protein